MRSQSRFGLSKAAITLIVGGVVCGGSLAAAVTHQIMTRRAVILTHDGKEYQVELLEMPGGASGTFVTDDGAVYGIDMVEKGERSHVTVDIDSLEGDTSTITLDTDAAIPPEEGAGSAAVAGQED